MQHVRAIFLVSVAVVVGGLFVAMHDRSASDHSNGHTAAGSDAQASGALDELSSSRFGNADESQGSASSSVIALTPFLRDYESNIKDEALKWANSTFITNTRGVAYDRVRLVSIDWFSLLQPIKNSELYLKAASDGTAEGFSSGDLYLEPFDDRRYQLVIERADVYNVNGVEVIALLGSAFDINGRRGSWQMSIDEYGLAISGHVDAPDGYTNLGPGPDNAFHVFRDLSQDGRREQMAGKKY